MDRDREAALRRRYLSLGVGELVAAGVFLVAALQMALPRLTPTEARALWGGLAPLLIAGLPTVSAALSDLCNI